MGCVPLPTICYSNLLKSNTTNVPCASNCCDVVERCVVDSNWYSVGVGIILANCCKILEVLLHANGTRFEN